jgi:hypothetical protein
MACVAMSEDRVAVKKAPEDADKKTRRRSLTVT